MVATYLDLEIKISPLTPQTDTNFCRFLLKAVFDKFSIDSGKREVDSQALSYGLHVLVSDIPANKEVDVSSERYFKCGDVDELREKEQFRDLGIWEFRDLGI